MKHFTGVHVTRDNLRAALISEDFAFVKEGAWDMGPEQHTQDGLVAIVTEAIRTVDPNAIATANGVTVPGTLHRWQGRIDACPDVPAWVGLRLKEALEQKLGGHVMMDKESNCVAAGEVLRGQAGYHNDLIAVHLGSHIDGALILHRHLWHGSAGMAGSLGHMVVDRDGPEAGDGTSLRGTLDAYISNSAIAARLKSRPVDGVDPTAADLLTRLAATSGPEAEDHLKTIGEAIATPLAGLINALDVRSVLISGIGQETYDRLAESVARGLATRVAPPLRENITLVPATTGDKAGLIGAGYNWLLQPHD